MIRHAPGACRSTVPTYLPAQKVVRYPVYTVDHHPSMPPKCLTGPPYIRMTVTRRTGPFSPAPAGKISLPGPPVPPILSTAPPTSSSFLVRRKPAPIPRGPPADPMGRFRPEADARPPLSQGSVARAGGISVQPPLLEQPLVDQAPRTAGECPHRGLARSVQTPAPWPAPAPGFFDLTQIAQTDPRQKPTGTRKDRNNKRLRQTRAAAGQFRS